MLMSPSALPLYNTDKLIYKSRFFNKFKETLPIVSWFWGGRKKKERQALTGVGRVRSTGEGAWLETGPGKSPPGEVGEALAWHPLILGAAPGEARSTWGGARTTLSVGSGHCKSREGESGG